MYSIETEAALRYITGITKKKGQTMTTDVTFGDYARTLSNAIYKAAGVIEECERQGLVRGNGHHARQHLCRLAIEELASRWNDKAEADEYLRRMGWQPGFFVPFTQASV